MVHCSICPRQPLNGGSSATEGARLRVAMRTCSQNLADTNALSIKGNPELCCPPPTPEVQPPITPCESSRILTLSMACGSPPSGQVTQSRARELLAKAQARQQYNTESMRVAALVQNTITCSTNPFDPDARFSMFARLAATEICPPIPPPPAPPARSCPLTKNQKY
jgi:hypothetical protein